MKKKGAKKEKADAEWDKLNQQILKLRDSVLEEFDMIELIEDSIKDVFDCDLNCVTCSREEQGKCMQNFKKGNLYWLRKIAQDEWMIKDIVQKMDTMREALVEMMNGMREYWKQKNMNPESLKENGKELTEEEKKKNAQGFYI